MAKDKSKNVKNIYSEDVPHNTKAAVKRLLHYMAPQKKPLIFVSAMALLSSGAYALIPLIVGKGIDQLLTSMRASNSTGALWKTVLLLFAASILTCLLSYIQQYVIASVGEKLTLSLRRDVSAKISRLPLQYFDTHQPGEVMSRITNDLEKVSTVIQAGLMQLLSASFTILFTAVAMLLIHPLLFVIVLVSALISAVATAYVSSLSQRFYAENAVAMGKLNTKFEEYYAGNRIIKAFNQQQEAQADVEALNEKQYRANRRAQFADYAIYPSIRFLNLLGFITTAIAGGLMALRGQISLGSIYAFLQYVNQISEPITQASYVITSLQAAIAGAERVFTLLDESEEPVDALPGADTITEGRVSFQDVRFGYTKERTLIRNLNMEVAPNQMVAIVGPTGGGKTTLVNLLMRFYDLNSGTIRVDGIDITAIPRRMLRRRIGMVLQDAWLFEGTIAENISYGKMNATREEIVAAAKAACCDHFIRTLPYGYDTVISAERSNISQGQMQLLTIARAMLMNPAIMILDEATSNVDTRTEVEIQKAMTRLMRDKTSFVIAHRLSTIQNADVIIVVKDGDIIEKGDHSSLIVQNGFYASLYNSQFEGNTAD